MVKRTVLACALLTSAATLAQATPAKGAATPSRSQVNWGTLVVRATGLGAPDLTASNPAQARLGAEKAAKRDALARLLAQVERIPVDASRTLGDLMESPAVRARVEGAAQKYRIVSKRYFSDDGLEIQVEVPLPALAEAIEPDAGRRSVGASDEGGSKVSGLVIDARGLQVTPALRPRLLDPQGRAVYAVDTLSAEARRTAGVAAYLPSIQEAEKSPRVGERPLVLKAQKADGADLLLGAEDAQKLSSVGGGLLAGGQVVIVSN
jgi:hypothetical protein